MQTPAGFDIRFSEERDLDFLTRYFADPAACDDFPFSPDEAADVLKNWIGFSKFKASLTGLINDEPCAIATLFLMPYRKVAHHASFFVAVDPAHRNQGIGTSMIRNIMNLAKNRFRLESVNVEIYEPSLLLPIVEKLGFLPFAKQPDFVRMENVHRPRILLECML